MTKEEEKEYDEYIIEKNSKYAEMQKKVNHPYHYQGANECIDIMVAMFGKHAVMDFCRCNAFKYRFRAKMKNGEEDIKKAEWYESYLINEGKSNA